MPAGAGAGAANAGAGSGGAGASGQGGSAALTKQLMDLTGSSEAECQAALAACGNNLDAAAGRLMGF